MNVGGLGNLGSVWHHFGAGYLIAHSAEIRNAMLKRCRINLSVSPLRRRG